MEIISHTTDNLGMSHTVLKSKQDDTEYLKKFVVSAVSTLFEPDWSLMKKGHCPICSNKLKVMRNKPLKYCNSKKHIKTFICKDITRFYNDVDKKSC